MKKTRPLWLSCLIIVAGTLLLNLRYWLPITENTGERYTLKLEKASAHDSYIALDFGRVDNFRIVRAPGFDALLEDKALGRTYEIIADYRSGGRKGRSWYDVYALYGMDGTVFLTLEESEALRQSALPRRLALTLGMDAVLCAVLAVIHWKRNAALFTKPKEESS